jgi:hypothetical protein
VGAGRPGAKAAADAAFALLLTVEQGTKHRRLCSWCLLSAAAGLAVVPQTLPEARAALRGSNGVNVGG